MAQLSDYVESEPLEADETSNIKDYLSVCLQRPWLIMGFVLVFGGGAAIWSYTQTPIYEAGARVLIQEKDPQVIKTQTQQDLGHFGSQIQTHVSLMMSIPVLQEVAEKLNLSERLFFRVFDLFPEIS